MGEAARRAYFRRTTPSERLDDGLRMSDEYLSAFLATVKIPPGATPEERAKIQFRAIRKAFG